MALPPFEAGAAKLTVACAFLAVAVPIVGAAGTVALLATVIVFNLHADNAKMIKMMLVARAII